MLRQASSRARSATSASPSASGSARSATANTLDEVAKRDRRVQEQRRRRRAVAVPAGRLPVVQDAELEPRQPRRSCQPATKPTEVRRRLRRTSSATSRAASNRDGLPGALRRRADLPGAAGLPRRHRRQVRDAAVARRDRHALRPRPRAATGSAFFGPLRRRRRKGATQLPEGLLAARAHRPGRAAPHLGPARHDGGALRDGHRVRSARATGGGKVARRRSSPRRPRCGAPREQIQALFGRATVALFPPPGVDDSETFFAAGRHAERPAGSTSASRRRGAR